MTEFEKQKLGRTLWAIADQLRGAMNADDFRDYMLSFLFLRYLSDNYEQAAKKELGSDYPKIASSDVEEAIVMTPLQIVHHVIELVDFRVHHAKISHQPYLVNGKSARWYGATAGLGIIHGKQRFWRHVVRILTLQVRPH